MYVALRDLRAARGRFALVGVVIGLVAFMTTLLTGLAAGLVDDGISGLRQLPLTHLAFEPHAGGTFSRSVLTEKNLGPWQDVPGVEASPIGVSFANAKDSNGVTVSLALFGVSQGSFLADRGDAKAALDGPPGLVLSDELADTGIKVGDLLTVAGSEVRLPVLGFTYAGSYGHVAMAITQLTTWQRLFYGDNAHGRFSAVALHADDHVTSGTLERAAAASETELLTKQESYVGSPGYSGETQTMTMIRGFLLVISALIVGAFFTVWTIQRRRQIALLKALGASTSYVVRDALGQMAVVLLAATAIGSAFAFALGATIRGTAVPFRLEVLPALEAVTLLVVIGLLGCFAAVRRITSVDPAGALRQID